MSPYIFSCIVHIFLVAVMVEFKLLCSKESRTGSNFDNGVLGNLFKNSDVFFIDFDVNFNDLLEHVEFFSNFSSFF